MPEELIAGGAGKDGKLTIVDAAGSPIGAAAAKVQTFGSNSLKSMDLQLGAPQVLGTLGLLNRAGQRRASLTGDGRMHLGGNGADGQITMNDRENANSVVIEADDEIVTVSLGAANKPARIQLTTGGNPGPTIDLDGSKNALLFQRAGSNVDNIVEINGAGFARFGGFGHDGRISVRGADGGEAVVIDGASGDVILGNADCAEEFDITGDNVVPGTVVVITDDGSLSISDKPYDRRVAGVVSGAGTFRPAIVMDRRDTGRTRAPIALVGKVYCYADATDDPITAGDLLTTGDYRGHAQRVVDARDAVGAILGKALAPLATGRGLIPVLVTLH